MKKRVILLSSLVLTLGVAAYFALAPKVASAIDTTPSAPKIGQVENATVQAFTEEYEKSPESAMNLLDEKYPDDYIVFHHPTIGGYFISPPEDKSSGPELDEHFNEIPGTDIPFTDTNSATIGQLKEVAQELENE